MGKRVCCVVFQSLETKLGCLGAEEGPVKKQVWLDGVGEGRLWGCLAPELSLSSAQLEGMVKPCLLGPGLCRSNDPV